MRGTCPPDFSASLPRSPPALQFAADGGLVQLFAQENQVQLGNDQPTSLHPSPPALMPISPEVSKGSRTWGCGQYDSIIYRTTVLLHPSELLDRYRGVALFTFAMVMVAISESKFP